MPKPRSSNTATSAGSRSRRAALPPPDDARSGASSHGPQSRPQRRSVSEPPRNLKIRFSDTAPIEHHTTGLVARNRSEPYRRLDKKAYTTVARASFAKGFSDSGEDEDTPSPQGVIDVPVTIHDQDEQQVDLRPRVIRFMDTSSSTPMLPSSTSATSSTPAPTATSYSVHPLAHVAE